MGAAGMVGSTRLQGARGSARPRMGATPARSAAAGYGVSTGARSLGWLRRRLRRRRPHPVLRGEEEEERDHVLLTGWSHVSEATSAWRNH